MNFKNILSFNKKPKKQVRKFEGASKSKRLSRWFTTSSDSNTINETDLPTLRNRSRYLTRNNPYARRGVDVIANNVVGKGIKVRFSNQRIQKLWNEWADSKDFDYEGQHTINSMQRLLLASTVEGGDVLIRKRVTDTKGSQIPLAYQLLEGDFLDTNLLDAKSSVSGSTIIQGVEFNAQGTRAGYHIYESHPGSIHQPYKLSSNFLSKDLIKHIYRIDRPGQVRGVPWLSPVIIRLKDLDEFEDAQIMRQKIAACFTAFVQDISDDVDCDEDDKVSKSEMMERIEPGIIEHLPTGKTITFTNPPSVENYKEFTSSQLRAIASGLGITYETISSDLAEVNFSAGRMGHLEMNRNIETWRQNIIIDDFLKPTVKEFLDMLTIIGEMVPANLTTEYIAPRREMIDPTKEIPALVTLIRAGLESRESVIAALGSDPDTVNKAIKKSNDLIDKNGFVFDTDPRNTAANGKLQQINNSSEVDDATESEQTGDQ